MNGALGDKDSTAYWQALADGYMESHPNVTIEMTDLGSTYYMTQLATQLAGGNGELDVLSIKDIPGYSNLINLGLLDVYKRQRSRIHRQWRCGQQTQPRRGSPHWPKHADKNRCRHVHRKG